MFTLGFFYTVVYLLIFLCLLIVSFFNLPIQLLTNLSASTFFIFLYKYSIFRFLFLFLVFCLTGLPPVGFFLIKFNIFCFVLYQVHVIAAVVLFLLFFFNMVYYIQFFNFKNNKLKLYSTVNTKYLSFWHSDRTRMLQSTTYNSYSLILFVVNISFALVSMILIFNDYFFILNLI